MSEDRIVQSLADEHRIVTRLVDNVKSVVAVIPKVNRGEWLAGIRLEFGRLRVHMKQHIEGEETGGFMEPVLEHRPTLSAEVQNLKDEHLQFAKLLDGIWDELSSVTPEDDLLIADMCHRIQHVISAIERHEEHEELLITFVFSQDIGGQY